MKSLYIPPRFRNFKFGHQLTLAASFDLYSSPPIVVCLSKLAAKMKFASVFVIVYEIVAMCSAEFIDESTVNHTCERGCNYEVKFTVKTTGFAKTAIAGREDCINKRTVSLDERTKTCGDR